MANPNKFYGRLIGVEFKFMPNCIAKNNKHKKVLTEKTLPYCHNCEKNLKQEEHPCPFASEIHNDESPCECCEECENECAQDI